MPSIAEATRANGTPTGRRFLVGVGLVAGGALLVGLGAGFTAGVSVQAGLLTGGALVLSCLVAVAVRGAVKAHERDLIAVGGVLGLASLLVLWTAPPAITGTATLSVIGAIGYLAALTVVVATMFARVSMAPTQSSKFDSSDSIAWTNSAAHGSSRKTAADGGSRDDDLTFLIDED